MDKRDFLDFDSGLKRGQAEVDFFQELIDKGELDCLPAKYTRRAAELEAQGRVSR